MTRLICLAAVVLLAPVLAGCGETAQQSGGTGGTGNVGGGATVVARPTTPSSPGQGSGSTLGSSTPPSSPAAR